MFKLAHILIGENISWLQKGAQVIIFGSMVILVVMIVALILMAAIYIRGSKIPVWAESLVLERE